MSNIPAPLVIVSKSEPKDHVPRLCALGLNAVAGEAGTDYVWYPHSQQWGIERKCVSIDTLVLKSDLHWVLAGTLKAGDSVLSVQEDTGGRKGGSRKWTISKIIHNETVYLPSVAVHLDDGTNLVCAEDHPWLTYARQSSKGAFYRAAYNQCWVPARNLKPGMRLPRWGKPWKQDTSYDAAYLAGALDREKRSSSGKIMHELRSRGGGARVLEFLGRIRPERLIQNLQDKWVGRPYGIRVQSRPSVISVSPVGQVACAAIEVAAGTYIAEGFAAHNTVSNLLGSLADRQLVEQTHRGAKQFDRYIILIEGAYTRKANGKLAYQSPGDPRSTADGWVESKWDYASVAGILFALQLVGDKRNILVHHWPVMYDAPTAIASIVQQTSSDDGARFTRERQRPDLPAIAVLGGELYSDALWALMALPGVGAEVAEALLKQHGSLYNVVLNAVSNDFANVKVNGKRLGDKRAEKITTAITTSFK